MRIRTYRKFETDHHCDFDHLIYNKMENFFLGVASIKLNTNENDLYQINNNRLLFDDFMFHGHERKLLEEKKRYSIE